MKALRDFIRHRDTAPRKSEHNDIRSICIRLQLFSQNLASVLSICKSTGHLRLVRCSHGAVSPCLKCYLPMRLDTARRLQRYPLKLLRVKKDSKLPTLVRVMRLQPGSAPDATLFP